MATEPRRLKHVAALRKVYPRAAQSTIIRRALKCHLEFPSLQSLRGRKCGPAVGRVERSDNRHSKSARKPHNPAGFTSFNTALRTDMTQPRHALVAMPG